MYTSAKTYYFISLFQFYYISSSVFSDYVIFTRLKYEHGVNRLVSLLMQRSRAYVSAACAAAVRTDVYYYIKSVMLR